MDIPDTEKRCGLILAQFEERFGDADGVRFFRAPGRVDLMGSHTDYNEGFILACAVDRDVIVGARSSAGQALRLYSLNMDLQVRLNLSELVRDKEHGWAEYSKGVIKELIELGLPVRGLDMIVHGTVPVGGNLSSSAALEAATCEAVLALIDRSLPTWEKIHLSRRAENVFVGMPCGIMDQFSVFMGKKDTALMLDCRSLEYRNVPLELKDAALLITNSGTSRELVASEYAKRVEECQAALKHYKTKNKDIRSLRDISADDLAGEGLDELLLKRVRHITSENERVQAAGQALIEGDLEQLGRLMDESYVSCRDDYHCSINELDVIHEIASSIEGVLGMRISGAGWGGCMVSLVKNHAIDEFKNRVPAEYKNKTGMTADVWTVQPGPGPAEIKRS